MMGPVIGAAILIPIAEVTRVWLGHKGTGVDMLIYGFLITIISVYQPQGVWGLICRYREENKMNKAICLEVKGMAKWFGGLAANQDIDFFLEEGEIVSVIGPNGAGKSTLFNCITGFL